MRKSQEIISPCISVCRINVESGFCQGCWRTCEEIRNWTYSDKTEKLEVLERLHERKKAAGVFRRRTKRRGRK